jgi:hypothetical protein
MILIAILALPAYWCAFPKASSKIIPILFCYDADSELRSDSTPECEPDFTTPPTQGTDYMHIP